MTLDPLEHNLAALVGRAYDPVRPSEAFREELVARALDEVTRRAARTDRRRRLRVVAGVAASLAAACVLAFLLLSRGEGSPSLRAILESGRVAWRPLGDPDEPWRARAIDDALPPSALPFAAATPAGAASVLLDGAGLRATLAADASVSVTRDPEGGVAFALDRGAIELESQATDESSPGAPDTVPHPSSSEPRPTSTWRLASGAARVHLEHGMLRGERRSAKPADGIAVLLASGSAWTAVAGARFEIPPGTGGVLSPEGFVPDRRDAEDHAVEPERADATDVALAPDSPDLPGSRVAVAADEVADVEEAGGANAGATLALTFVAPEGSALPADALPQVTLLRVTSLPNVVVPEFAEPVRRADGAFALEGIAADSYWVDVAVEGFALWKGGPFALDLGVELAVTVSLELATRVHGVVVDPEGRPVLGAWVVSEQETPEIPLGMSQDQWIPNLAPVAVTASDGRFVLALRSGEHVLRAIHDDHAPGWSQPFAVERGATVAEQRIALQCGATLRGTVERVDGRPWGGVEVVATCSDLMRQVPRMSFRGAVTDAQGMYTIEKLPQGSYAILHLGSPTDPTEARQPEMRLLDIGACDEVRVDFTRAFTGARVFGRMTTSGGEPVGGMGLSLVRDGASSSDQLYGYSAPGGDFEFLEVPPENYSFFLTPDEGRTVVRIDELVVPEWVAIEHDVVLPTEAASGVVRAGATGEGLPGSVVLVFAIASPDDAGRFVARTMTDGEGRFSVPHLARGYYRLVVFSTLADFGQEILEDVLPTEDGQPFVVNLHPGGRLRVRVIARGGAPIAAARLVFVNEVGMRVSFAEEDETDAAGQRLARGVKPGAWTVRASAQGYADAERIAVVRENEEAFVELVLEPLGR